MTLNWDGKDSAVNAANNVPLRLLQYDSALSYGDKNSGNIIVQGDNLNVLKSLLPIYRGQVKCIYIDPPYNTGAAFEHYNDNFPHSDWLNMMYPRLELLREFLSNDGAIFISIDDTEQAYLKIICDEIFGRDNFVAQFCVKRSGGRQDSKFFAVTNEFLFCYAKNVKYFVAGEEIKATEKFPKFDEVEGKFYKTQLLRKWGSNSRRIISAPDGTKIFPMLPNGTEGCWRWGKNKMQDAIDEGLIEFVKKNGEWIAYEKIFQTEDAGTKKFTTWIDENFSGADDLKNIFGEKVFDYPKSVGLIEKILKMCNADKNSIVLDSFAGSGTTAHAVQNLNAADGGNRKFILIEMEDYAEEFSFYELGEQLFDDDDFINEAVPREKLFDYIFYSETRKNFVPSAEENLIGVADDTAYYYFDELSWTTLSKIKTRAKNYVIYAEVCNLSEDELIKYKITYKQIPFDVRRY